MKTIKLFMVSALCAMTLVATAAPTAVAKISIASASGNGNDAVILVESSDCTSAIEDGKDIVKIMNDANDYSINLYAVSNDTNLSAIGTDDLSNTALTFVSNKTETSYTMTFSNVTGTVKLYDAVEAQEVTLANAGTYTFTATANSTIADRFIINRVAPAASLCFTNNTLEVNGHAGETLKVTKDGADIVAEFTLTDTYSVDLSAYTGRLVVTLNGVDYQIHANPEVKPL